MNRFFSALVSGLVLVAAPSGAVAAAPSEQVDPAELSEARAIIAVMFPPAERMNMITRMQDQMMAQMGPLLPASISSDPGLSAIMTDYLDQAKAKQRTVMQARLPEMTEALAVAYTREYSLPELKEIRAFAQTRAGSHYLSKATAMVGDPAVARVNTAMFQDIRAVTDSLAPGFRDKVVAYLKAHPDVAAKIEAADKKAQ